jgi:hypothetical protein
VALCKREDILSQIDADIYGSEAMDQRVPRYRMPQEGLRADVAHALVSDELIMDGNARQNLATFCTTYLDAEIHPLMDASLDKKLVQGLVVTVMSCLYFVIKNVSVVFFLVGAMTVALYLIAYMLMYAAGLRLRYSKPNLPRPFRVPFGLAGMWLVAGVGLVGVCFSFLVAFFPPDQLPVGSPALYVTLVVVGTVVFCGIPLLLHFLRRPNWVKADPEPGETV